MTILDVKLDFSFVQGYSNVLLDGILTTLWLSLIVIITTTILGTIVGIAMTRKIPGLRYALIIFTDLIRSIPVLVLILLVYYAFPVFGLSVSNPTIPAAFALVLNNTVFLADLVRGSIESLPSGSIKAARALGFSRLLTLRRIIVPEVYREILPSVTLLFISIIKLTSLASIIAVYELTHVGDWIIASSYKPFEMYIVITLLYIAIIFPLTLLSRYLESSPYFKRRSI